MKTSPSARAALGCALSILSLGDLSAGSLVGTRHLEFGLGHSTSGDYRTYYTDVDTDLPSVTDFSSSANGVFVIFNRPEWSGERFGLDFVLEGRYVLVSSDVRFDGEVEEEGTFEEEAQAANGRQLLGVGGLTYYAKFEGWRPFVTARFGFYRANYGGLEETSIAWKTSIGSEFDLGEDLTAVVSIDLLGQQGLGNRTTGGSVQLYYQLNEKWALGGFLEQGWSEALSAGKLTGGIVASLALD